MLNGTRIMGCCEGDSRPEKFIPELIAYYREGKLPLGRMGRRYKVSLASFRACSWFWFWW